MTHLLLKNKVFQLVLLLLIQFSGIAQSFIRKPYLQKLGSNNLTVKFRLKESGNATIFWGTDRGNMLSKKSSSASALDHEITLDSLKPETFYYYKVQLDNNVVQADTSWYFKTAPIVGSKSKFSFWTIGDLYPGPQQVAVYEGFKKFRNNQYTNLFLSIGDNVYCNGTEECFQSNFFDVYQNGSVLQQSGFYPSTGNHDYDGFAREVDNPAMAYYKSFILPSQGELGGIPSQSEGYYSYDYANVHFVVLESYAAGKDGKRLFEKDNIQLNWLKTDLAKNKQDWTIVYFHYPLYTKGSYDSDANTDIIKLRETLAPIFDQFKVDLVLTGHSHTMERSKPTQGHYGLSSTFDPSLHQPQSSSGLYDGSANSCPYFFDASNPSKSGVIYVTNGAAGATGRPAGFGHHPIMQFDRKDKIGSFFCEVEGNKLVGKFIDDLGLVLDQFTVFRSKDGKCVNCFSTQPNYGCGPTKKPNILTNPLSNYCQGQNLTLKVKGDDYATFRWTDAKGIKSEGAELSVTNLLPGKNNWTVSQFVNGFESETTEIPIYVHESPLVENATLPKELNAYVVQTIFLKSNDSIQHYTWSLPAGWEGSSTSNSIAIKPNANAGEVKVFGTSKFGCVSNELKLNIQLAAVLGTDEQKSSIKLYPNPVTGNTLTIEVPAEYLGAQGQFVNAAGQVLTSHKIHGTIQQHLVPNSTSGVIFYQIIYPGGSMSVKVAK